MKKDIGMICSIKGNIFFNKINKCNTPLKDKVASPVVLEAKRYETFTKARKREDSLKE